MTSRSIVPLIDMVFLTLGALLAAMTQMERVTAIPVDVPDVGQGAAIVQQGELVVVALRHDGLFLDDRPVTPDELARDVIGGQVVLRAEHDLPSQKLLDAVALLTKAGADIALEVEEHPER